MDHRSLRVGRLAAACFAVLTVGGAVQACDTTGKHPPASIGGGGPLASARARLTAAPFTELSFVPADAEAVVRVDLRVLATRDEETQKMLDFLLRAQQPTAWKLLGDAGVHAGQELRAVYLVVGPRGRERPAQSMLGAGVGDIDVARARAAFGGGGGVAEVAPGGGTIFVWPHARVALGIGATIPDEKIPAQNEDQLLEQSAIGVADGLILFGPPTLVRRALAVRAGEGKDVRVGELATELAELDGATAAWGVARQDEDGLVRALAPGLRAGRFHLAIADAPASARKGELRLRAEFGGHEDAQAFANQLETMIGAAAVLTKKTPMGETLGHMRDETPVRVEGRVVSIGATF
jgi:hypothetical protein